MKVGDFVIRHSCFVISIMSFVLRHFPEGLLAMGWLILGAILPSMLVCWAAAWLIRRWGPLWGLVDRPGHRKIHHEPMPTGGGLAIWLGIVAPFAAGQLVLWMLATSPDKTAALSG
ncbi:MAG TPA: hypothetical protein ENH84_00950, partial [Phycisphaerae bacterium]|nr:hypothetical protein [Phycisphaerae bacterium]